MQVRNCYVVLVVSFLCSVRPVRLLPYQNSAETSHLERGGLHALRGCALSVGDQPRVILQNARQSNSHQSAKTGLVPRSLQQVISKLRRDTRREAWHRCCTIIPEDDHPLEPLTVSTALFGTTM